MGYKNITEVLAELRHRFGQYLGTKIDYDCKFRTKSKKRCLLMCFLSIDLFVLPDKNMNRSFYFNAESKNDNHSLKEGD